MFIGFLEEKLVRKNYINSCKLLFERSLKRLAEKEKQWLWFVILWLFGVGCVAFISYLIKIVI